MEFSSEALIRAAIILLYASVAACACRWLMPRLSPTAKLLAGLWLAAQALVIAVGIFIQPAASFDAWLWRLNLEWNIFTTLSSTQLALVAAVALMIAWRGGPSLAWRRLYFLLLCLVFLLMAYDEYSLLLEKAPNRDRNYMFIGIAVVAATLVLAFRAPRPAWIWYACLLAGLALSAAGGLLIDALCCNRIFEVIAGWSELYQLEESLEILGAWLALVAALGLLTQLVASPSARLRPALFAFPALWLPLLFLSDPIDPVARYADGATSAARVEYAGGLRLDGVLLERQGRHISLFISPGRWDFHGEGLTGLGYSIHLIDQVSKESVLSRNSMAQRRSFLPSPGYRPVYRQWLDLGDLSRAPVNRAMWIVLTLWRRAGDGYEPLQISASDWQQLSDRQVILGELVLPGDAAPAPPGAPLAIFDNGFALDEARLPARGVAGESLAITFVWSSAAQGSEDYAQFLHFLPEGGGDWWNYDQQPLGARLPTRLWYRGLADSQTWEIPLPADLAPGRYMLFTGLYRLREQERMPVKDAAGTSYRDGSVPLGVLDVD